MPAYGSSVQGTARAAPSPTAASPRWLRFKFHLLSKCTVGHVILGLPAALQVFVTLSPRHVMTGPKCYTLSVLNPRRSLFARLCKVFHPLHCYSMRMSSALSSAWIIPLTCLGQKDVKVVGTCRQFNTLTHIQTRFPSRLPGKTRFLCSPRHPICPGWTWRYL